MGGHGEREHKRYSPSQAERVIACPGSPNLLDRVPVRTTSEYAIEGTKAHEILDDALRNNCRRAVTAHREYSTLFAEDFDDDFFYSIQICLNYVYGILDEFPDAEMFNERYVEPPTPSSPGDAGGFFDVAIHIPSLRQLYVIDFKHGGGYAKAAKDNPQPKQYAAGLLYEDNPIIDVNDIDEVVCVIVQPRAWHLEGTIREAKYTPYEIYEYICDYDEAIRKTQDINAPLVPEEEPGGQCTFCDAKTICPAREAFALSKISVSFKNVGDLKAPAFKDVYSVDLTRLSFIVQWKEYVMRYFNDAEAHLKDLLAQGFSVPDFKLVEAEARRTWWGDEADVAFKLAAMANVPITEVYKPKLLGIIEAERLVVEAFKANAGRAKKKQAAEDARQAFALLTLKKSSGGISMVRSDDPRQPINRAASAFTGIGELLQPPVFTEK